MDLEAIDQALDRPRVQLVDQPTAVQRLERLERKIGSEVRIFVKREDLTSIGGGGNKLRKLEFLLGEARERKCDVFMTVGGIQSNHARLTAAAAARTGLACELVLSRLVPRDDPEYRLNGNRMLDSLFGATVHELDKSADAMAFAAERAGALSREGRRTYVVGAGGSSPAGCLGCVACAREIAGQERELGISFSTVALANGSAGTHAGLAAGFAAMERDPRLVRSFAVLEAAGPSRTKTLALARQTLALLGSRDRIDEAHLDVDDSQRGDGYGAPTKAMVEAVTLMARTEGLLLDPVYSGKAFAGLLADIRGGKYAPGENVLFVMTGGVPGLFAYRPAFDPSAEPGAAP